ncbi:sensor domain-containing diguanylate cyclase [Halomonas sp.]|uniref:sensor domain-containing diguanylate cyclase n=1 Tax=Halomonas sp. TaxID=1486246 RepID=UPI0025C632B9|nr:sensor domain-containing diguanylate cyclase [Halomonas sp.]
MERVRRAWHRWWAGEERVASGLGELFLARYPGAVMLLDDQGVVLQVNPEFERHAGHAPGQLLGRRAVTLDADPLHGGFALALEHCRTTRQPWQGVLLCRRANGDLRHQTTMIQPLEECPDGALRLLVIQYDVTGMRERELHDRQLLARLGDTVSRLPGTVFRLRQDAAGHLELLYASEGLMALTGLTPEQVMDDIERLLGRVTTEDRRRLEVALAQSAVSLEPCQLELRLDLPGGLRWLEARARPQRRRDGSTLWDGLLIEVTERKAEESRIRRLVSTDMLTGALNRRAFFEQGAAVHARALRQGQALPLAMLDLDHFKALNDTHGHAAGDLALQVFAATCRECLRPYDLFARIGGEEFVVVLVDTSLAEAWAILERLRRAVEEITLEVEGGEILRFTVSLGLANLPPDGNLDVALGDADRALYRAKHEGRNRICGPDGMTPPFSDADPT